MKEVEKMTNSVGNKSRDFIEEYIIYLRKSRADNPNEPVEEVLKRHEKQLQEIAIKLTGKPIPEENIYREVASGETLKDRPEIQKVFKRMEVGNIKGVLTVDVQRLSRGDLSDAGRVVDNFFYTNTQSITCNYTYDLSKEFDKKMFEQELRRGNDYLDYQKNILLRGRLTSLKEGKWIFSVSPFGYEKVKISEYENSKEKGFTLAIKDDEAEIVKTIFELCLEGLGTTNIANYLNKTATKSSTDSLWTPNMVRNVLTSETYCGYMTWNKRKTVKQMKDGQVVKSRPLQKEYDLYKGRFTPLVTEEEFQIVQSKITGNGTPRNSKDLKNPLAGIVYCKKCGHIMIRRPYSKSFLKQDKRKYEINKEALQQLLRTAKNESGLSLTQIAYTLNVTKDQVVAWFSPNLKKMHLSKTFSAKWYELKELLKIETDEFDKAIMTFEKPPIQKDTLMCSTNYCDNVSSELLVVENRLISSLNQILGDFNNYIDNYEEEIQKELKNNSRLLNQIDNKIEKLNRSLKNALRNWNDEKMEDNEYFELKAELKEEIKNLEEQRQAILAEDKEEKITRYKKAIPQISKVLNAYPKLEVSEKNMLLKSILEKVEYTKTTGGRWNTEARDDFKLEIELKFFKE